MCHMANTIPQLFVPVQTLAALPVPLLFIYISAWMGERRTEREGFPLKSWCGGRCRHCLGSGAQKYLVLGLRQCSHSVFHIRANRCTAVMKIEFFFFKYYSLKRFYGQREKPKSFRVLSVRESLNKKMCCLHTPAQKNSNITAALNRKTKTNVRYVILQEYINTHACF